jgi:hypothetical protein
MRLSFPSICRRLASAATAVAIVTVANSAHAQAACSPPAGTTFAPGTRTNNPGVAAASSSGSIVITVKWDLASACGARARVTAPEIRARVPVVVHVTNFNFLRYSIRFSVEEDTVEAYRYLDKLWMQLFSLGGMVAAGPGGTPFENTIFDWRVAMRSADQELSAFVDSVTGIGLSDDMLKRVDARRKSLGIDRIRQLDSIRSAAFELVEASKKPTELDTYERIEANHVRVMERLTAFVSAATQTVEGSRRTIKPTASGTVVTVTMAARDQNSADVGAPLSIEYFVQSKLPVQFHAGLGYTAVRNIEFEKVRALSGQDLFAQVRDASGDAGTVVFLSYPLTSWGAQGEHAPMLSIGTQLTAPGKSVSLGGSLRLFSRIYLTGGVASDVVAEGGNKILDRLGDELDTRELFDVVTKRRKWGPFGAISFSVIR